MAVIRTYARPKLQHGTAAFKKSALRFSAWAEHYSDLSFADVKFWECENVVFAEVNVVGGGLPDGGLKEMHRITIEDGQITEFQDYFDSAPYLAILAQNK